MRQIHLGVAAAVLLFVGTGCATVRGDKQKVKFVTEPAGASLAVDGQKYTTPAEVELKRKEGHDVSVSKAGYRPIEFKLESTWDGAALTDVALPGGSALMGLSVASGSDKAFNNLATIKLEKTTDPNPKPLRVYQFHGKLYEKAEYDRLVDEEAKTKFRTSPD